MTPSKTATRAAAATALVLAALSWGSGSPAAAAVPATATVSAVTCVAGDGQVDITLTAGEEDATFTVYIDDAAEDYEVAANQSETVPVTGLDDDDHTVEVEVVYPALESEPATLLEQTRTVACDEAPVGPYTNAQGAVGGGCSDEVEVSASNEPIGGNTADLQPVRFTVTLLPSDPDEPTEPGDDEPGNDEPGDDEPGDDEPEDPRRSAVDPIVLDTFVLDATTPTYERTFVLGDDGDYPYGEVVLTADGADLDLVQYGTCVAGPLLPTSAAGGLPNTGA